jgi:hypothetical protein
MARGKYTFRQREVTAALKAVRKSGTLDARIELDRKTAKSIVYVSKNQLLADDPSADWAGYESEVSAICFPSTSRSNDGRRKKR